MVLMSISNTNLIIKIITILMIITNMKRIITLMNMNITNMKTIQTLMMVLMERSPIEAKRNSRRLWASSVWNLLKVSTEWPSERERISFSTLTIPMFSNRPVLKTLTSCTPYISIHFIQTIINYLSNWVFNNSVMKSFGEAKINDFA